MSASTRRSQELYRRAKQLIPGGTQLLSKRPEMFAPDQWPAYYQSARGCEIVDLDGNLYLDFSSMGIGACLLGYADPDVTAAVIQRAKNGSMCTLNSADEVTLAERLLEIHPWASMVRYTRTGGEAMTVAVRIARAVTGRDKIAFCGYHGWHDWYLAANRVAHDKKDQLVDHLLPGLSPTGVPFGLASTAIPFTYNKVDELNAIVREHGNRLAAVVMEPTRSFDPQPGFLEDVRAICDKAGMVLVFDEITAGWRFTLGGAHLRYKLEPDIAVFAKTLGNGHPMAAIVGREAVMQAAQHSFISSTYWTEGVGPAAALAVIDKLRKVDVPAHVFRIGTEVREGLLEIGRRQSVPVQVSGHPALTSFGFGHAAGVELMTLFTVRMLSHGVLTGSSFYPSLAHESAHVERYLAAAHDVFVELREAIAADDIETRIGGPAKHTGFKRLT